MFKVYANRRMAALVGIGFASGLPNVLAGDAIAAWLSAVEVDVTSIGLFALINVPYTFKFLWAPFLDRFTPPGLDFLGRRRGWLIVLQMLLTATLAGLAFVGPETPNDDLVGFAVLGAAMVLLSASQDIVADGYRTDVLGPTELGAGAAVFVTGYRIATIVGGAFVLILAGKIGWRSAFGLMAIYMMLAAVVTWLAPEPRTSAARPSTLAEAVVQPVAQFITQRGLAATILIAIFIIVFRLPDSLGNRMTMPLLLNHLQFTAEEVGWIRQLLGFFITILGALTGGAIVARFGLMRSLIVFGILQAVSNGGFYVLAQTDPTRTLLAVVIGIESFCGGLVASGFVAFLMSCCDPRYSATQYALLSSLMALALSIAGAISGFAVAKFGYADFFLLSIAAGIPGMAMLAWLRPMTHIAEPHV